MSVASPHARISSNVSHKVIFQTFHYVKSASERRKTSIPIHSSISHQFHLRRQIFLWRLRGRWRVVFFLEFSVKFDLWEGVTSITLSFHCFIFTKYKAKILHHQPLYLHLKTPLTRGRGWCPDLKYVIDFCSLYVYCHRAFHS